ncbi:hypothetical protein HOH45_00515 [bacterium]|jgi:hypothetical protein|nr:hypothetical protein [bacterium]
MDLKKTSLVIFLILVAIGLFVIYPSEIKTPFTTLINKTQIQNKIKIEITPSIKKIKSTHIIKFEIDIESFENTEIIDQDLSETSFGIINSDLIKPTKWKPYQQSKYHVKGTLFFSPIPPTFETDSQSSVSPNVLKLLIFDPEEREYTWTY